MFCGHVLLGVLLPRSVHHMTVTLLERTRDWNLGKAMYSIFSEIENIAIKRLDLVHHIQTGIGIRESHETNCF